MKYPFIILVLIISLKISVFAQWDILNQGLNGFTEDADFVGNHGWIAGYTTLLKTDDNGLNWYEMELGEDLLIARIDFIDSRNGWAYGFSNFVGNNVIAFTDNGGVSWEIKHIMELNYANDLFALNKDTVFVLGPSFIMRTMDGFQNIITTNVKNEMTELRSIDFFSNTHGIAVGGSYGPDGFSIILRTNDGGIAWEELTDKRTRNILNIRLAADSTAFFTAQDDSGRTLFCKTADFFDSWTVQKRVSNYANYIIHPVSRDTIFSVTTFFGESQQLLIEMSYDSGINWLPIKEMPFWGMKYIGFEQGTGFVVGSVGGGGFISQPYGPLVLRSEDGGFTWDIKLFSYPFMDVQFLDDSKGFAVGGSMDIHHQAGEVFITTNGGQNWDVLRTAGTEIPEIQFVNQDIGFYLVGARGQLYKTNNGGADWHIIYENNYDSTGISLLLYGFKFIDTQTGWMVGEMYEDASYACIMKTEDGGQKWEYSYKIKEAGSFKDIFMFDAQNGWAAGSQGLMAKLSQGEWQQIPVITDKSLNKVYFSDANRGWISAGFDNMWYYDNYLLKTTNGGDDWQEVKNFPYLIQDIFFENNNTGWMVGADTSLRGVIFYTENGGNDWDVLVEGLPATLHAIYFNTHHGWALGDKGLVLRSADGINWIENPEYTRQDFKLYQNYPNPFNSISNFEFRISHFAHVELSIYNILGQKVATLVDKKHQPGDYKISWDATGFASGIYIYTLEIKDSPRRTSSGFKQSRKLVLLK